MKICYFGGYRADYARSRTQILALRRAGYTVVECRVHPKVKTIVKIFRLIPIFWATARNSDVIMVAEFNQSLMPMAWLLSRMTRAALVFDPAISYYDEMVITQNAVASNSMRGRYLKILDDVAFRLADCVVWYMPADCDYFGMLFPSLRGKQAWSPPAIDEQTFAVLPPKPRNGQFVVHFNSSYLPTHGVDVILRAARRLHDDAEIIFDLVGRGPTYESNVALAESLALRNVIFRDSILPSELPQAYMNADVCLGAMRDDAKLARLIELKIISAMASGRTVIAADSPLKRFFFKPDHDIVLVPASNPDALAEAIRKLKANPDWSARIAEMATQTARKHFSLDQVSRKLSDILINVVQKRRGVVV
jgi:glycosyltransferase involved in cell wall biosynthesis